MELGQSLYLSSIDWSLVKKVVTQVCFWNRLLLKLLTLWMWNPGWHWLLRPHYFLTIGPYCFIYSKDNQTILFKILDMRNHLFGSVFTPWVPTPFKYFVIFLCLLILAFSRVRADKIWTAEFSSHRDQKNEKIIAANWAIAEMAYWGSFISARKD